MNKEQYNGLKNLHKFFQKLIGKFYGDEIEWKGESVRFKSALSIIKSMISLLDANADYRLSDDEKKYLNKLRDIALYPPIKKLVEPTIDG